MRVSSVRALSRATTPGGVRALLMNAATPPRPGSARPRWRTYRAHTHATGWADNGRGDKRWEDKGLGDKGQGGRGRGDKGRADKGLGNKEREGRGWGDKGRRDDGGIDYSFAWGGLTTIHRKKKTYKKREAGGRGEG